MTPANSIMLGQKSIIAIAASLAVVVAAIAAIIVSANRENTAKAYAEAAASDEARAEAEAKTERARAAATNDMARAAEANEKARADERAAAEANERAKAAEQAAAADNKATAEANAAAERANAEARRAIRDTEKATNETARIELQRVKELAAVEQANADREAAKRDREKLESDRKVAEMKTLEYRKINYEEVERNLRAWKLELDERERALRPEMTSADLEWAGGKEDVVFDADGKLTKQAKVKYDPAQDKTRTRQSRYLTRVEREIREGRDEESARSRTNAVNALKQLYLEAKDEDRVIDAEYYRKNILSLYPDWKLKDEESSERD